MNWKEDRKEKNLKNISYYAAILTHEASRSILTRKNSETIPCFKAKTAEAIQSLSVLKTWPTDEYFPVLCVRYRIFNCLLRDIVLITFFVNPLPHPLLDFTEAYSSLGMNGYHAGKLLEEGSHLNISSMKKKRE